MSANTLQRMALFPSTARVEGPPGNEQLTIGECNLFALAARHGTPLYLYDQATLDSAVEDYREALGCRYPGESGITYAGKAFLCVALAQWAQRLGLWLDCTGAGEIRIAQVAGVPAGQVVVHGVNKSENDLRAAMAAAGTLVVDHLTELEQLVALAGSPGQRMPDLWFRLRPGLAVATHVYRQTGQEDSKFGMDRREAARALEFCRQHGLTVTGVHFHLGSQFRDSAPVGVVLELALDLVAELYAESNWLPQVLCPGGGWGVAYHEDDLPQPSVPDYVHFVADGLAAGCRARGIPLPRLQLEPGRSIVARAGVALYRVGAVKRTAHQRWVLVDGGLADNIRPALYGVRYSALPVWQPARPSDGLAWLAGPYCESGDVLIEALPLPDVQPGELIAVPVSGAYHLSMASNYNGALRPAVVWLDQGRAHLVQAREQIEDLVRRDRPLPSC